MFISYYNLKNTIEKYREIKDKKDKKDKNLENTIENYKNCHSFNRGFSRSFETFTLVISVIFFIFELILLYFAIFIAINCSKSVEERIINFVLAITFTIPYVFFSILFNPCAKNYIRNGMKLS